MNKILACAVAVVCVGALTSCSSGSNTDSSAGTSMTKEAGGVESSPAPDDAAQTGSSSGQDPSEPTSEGTGAGDGGEAPTPEPKTDPLEQLELNDHGNEPVDKGESAIFQDLTSDAEYAQLTATNVQTNFKCMADDASESINGQYVALSFDVNAFEALNDSGFTELYFSVHDFRAWDGDGEKVIDVVGNAESCISEDERIQTPILPGSEASGLVVLDVPEGHGSASFTLGGFEGAYGWEWSW